MSVYLQKDVPNKLQYVIVQYGNFLQRKLKQYFNQFVTSSTECMYLTHFQHFYWVSEKIKLHKHSIDQLKQNLEMFCDFLMSKTTYIFPTFLLFLICKLAMRVWFFFFAISSPCIKFKIINYINVQYVERSGMKTKSYLSNEFPLSASYLGCLCTFIECIILPDIITTGVTQNAVMQILKTEVYYKWNNICCFKLGYPELPSDRWSCLEDGIC